MHDAARIPELLPAVTRLAETNVEAGDRVAMLTTPSTDGAVTAALRTALRTVGADVTTLTVVPNGERNHPLDPIVAAAVDAADVVVNCGATTGFPPELLAFVRNGGRHLKVYATAAALTGGTAAAHLDAETHDRMRRDVERFAERLTAAEAIRVTAPAGTDLTASLAGMTARRSVGDAAAQHGHTAFPTGETDVTPVPGSIEGTVVLDTSMSGIGWVDTPIELDVEGSRIVGLDGGGEARRLEDMLEGWPAPTRTVGELGFGMNPRTRPTGVATNDKKLRGAGHVGLGDVTAWPTLTGDQAMAVGEREQEPEPAPAHLDGIFRRVSVRLDGELVIDEGELLL